MAVAHTDFLNSAMTMLDVEEGSEIFFRNSGSRAYYALYHKAKSVFDESGVKISKVANSGSHEALISAVAALGPKGKVIAVALDKFKKFRHSCDYDLQVSIEQSRINFYLKEAERLTDMLGRLEVSK